MDDLYTLVMNMGLAIALAVYLVRYITVKLSSQIERMNKTLEELRDAIKQLNMNFEWFIKMIDNGESLRNDDR